MAKYILILSLLFGLIYKGSAIYCYRCHSSQPGCSTPFNWRGIGYLGEPCPESDDICVKVIERKGATDVITRECLSALKSFRSDIPADHYEGCRPAALDVKLANYVNNTIKELDIKRDYYDSTTWCFCFLDHRCNSSTSISISLSLFVSAVVATFLLSNS